MNFLVEFFDAALKLPDKELISQNKADRPNEMALTAELLSPEQIEEWAKKKLAVRRQLSVDKKKEIVRLLIEVVNGKRHLIELSCERKGGMPDMSFKIYGKERKLPVTMVSDCSRIIKEVVEELLPA